MISQLVVATTMGTWRRGKPSAITDHSDRGGYYTKRRSAQPGLPGCGAGMAVVSGNSLRQILACDAAHFAVNWNLRIAGLYLVRIATQRQAQVDRTKKRWSEGWLFPLYRLIAWRWASCAMFGSLACAGNRADEVYRLPTWGQPGLSAFTDTQRMFLRAGFALQHYSSRMPFRNPPWTKCT